MQQGLQEACSHVSRPPWQPNVSWGEASSNWQLLMAPVKAAI